ncbi:hypothetical protein FRC06_000655, partial [Ceratobasidium sp. 370]
MEGHLRASGGAALPQTLQPSFSSAMVLLVDILATKNAERQGLRVSGSRGVLAVEESYPTWEKEQDVERCIEVLAHSESRWHIAGRLHDVLRELQRSGGLLTPESTIPQPTVAGSGLARPSASPWALPPQPPVELSTVTGAPMTNQPVAFNPNILSPEYGSLETTRPAAVLSGVTHHMSSGPSAHGIQ